LYFADPEAVRGLIMEGNGTLARTALRPGRIGAADLAWTDQFAENAIMEHPLPALSGLISPHDR
jgi:enoyl-CoA hydratase/carnithine racemase